MATFVVTYPKTTGVKFDADYYVSTHVPLVRKHLTQQGMISIQVLIPEGDDAGYAAIALLEFASLADCDRALQSPDAAPVFADIGNFTDIVPVAVRCERR